MRAALYCIMANSLCVPRQCKRCVSIVLPWPTITKQASSTHRLALTHVEILVTLLRLMEQRSKLI